MTKGGERLASIAFSLVCDTLHDPKLSVCGSFFQGLAKQVQRGAKLLIPKRRGNLVFARLRKCDRNAEQREPQAFQACVGDHQDNPTRVDVNSIRCAQRVRKFEAGAFVRSPASVFISSGIRRQNEALPPICQNLGSCEPVAAPKLPSGKFVSTFA